MKVKLTLPLVLHSQVNQTTRKNHASLTRPKPSNSPATTLGFLMRYRNADFSRPIMTIRGLVSNRLRKKIKKRVGFWVRLFKLIIDIIRVFSYNHPIT